MRRDYILELIKAFAEKLAAIRILKEKQKWAEARSSLDEEAKGLVVVHSCSRGIVKENITESSYWKSKLKPRAVNIIGL